VFSLNKSHFTSDLCVTIAVSASLSRDDLAAMGDHLVSFTATSCLEVMEVMEVMDLMQVDIGGKIVYPLVNIQKAIENGHRNSEFSHEQWWIFP
jgi:hypothetical protein